MARSLDAAFPGIVLKEEGTHEATGYDLDIVLDTSRFGPRVVEFDGPTHFLQVGGPSYSCTSQGAYADPLMLV